MLEEIVRNTHLHQPKRPQSFRHSFFLNLLQTSPLPLLYCQSTHSSHHNTILFPNFTCRPNSFQNLCLLFAFYYFMVYTHTAANFSFINQFFSFYTPTQDRVSWWVVFSASFLAFYPALSPLLRGPVWVLYHPLPHTGFLILIGSYI